jgi:transposase
MQSFRRKGKAGLKPRPTPGRPPEMLGPQKRELIGLLRRGACAAGYSTEMWTTRRVAEQIQRHWGISYHPGHVWKILIGLGWSCQKPERRAIQRNPWKIRQWKQRDWPRIKKTRRLRAHLVFLDESGFMLIPPVLRTWAPVGRTPVLRHSYRRERLSVIGGLSMSPARQQLGLYFQIYPWNVTAVEIVQYFAELLRHLRGQVVVLLDGGSIHRDRKVVQFCHSHRRLHLERFPAYAPELNPEEYVWTQTKQRVQNS